MWWQRTNEDLAVLNWKWCHRTTGRINQQIMPQSQPEQNQINDSNLPLPHLDEIYYHQGHSSPGKKKEQEVAQGNKEWAVRSEWSLVILGLLVLLSFRGPAIRPINWRFICYHHLLLLFTPQCQFSPQFTHNNTSAFSWVGSVRLFVGWVCLSILLYFLWSIAVR